MVPEIGSEMDRYFCHFEPFFALLVPTLLPPPPPPNNLENQNFKKMKNASGDVILLHMCTINENHMMYDS